MTKINVSINQLPFVGNAITIFMSVILDDETFNEVTITSLKVLYGRVNLQQPNIYIPKDESPTAILVTGTLLGNQYIGIFYTNAITPQIVPNNFVRLTQKIPLGIFNDLSTDAIVGQDMKARSMMIDDYYKQAISVQQQVYSFEYSPQLEFQYNGTIGLLSDSLYPQNLFLWFSSLNNVALNTYDLELAVSQYIFYRIGVSSAVFINDGVVIRTGRWNLGVPTLTELDSTTILGDTTPTIINLEWKIYNSGSFSNEFKLEITNLVNRISRADVGNGVTFTNIVDPATDGFTFIGYTYKNDPRTLFGKCTQFIGISQYPINIFGYRQNV